MKKTLLTLVSLVIIISSLALLTSCINVDGADAIAALEQLNNEKIQQLEREHQEEIEQLQNEYEQRLAVLELDYKTQITGLEAQISGYDSQITELQMQHADEFEVLEKEYNSQLADLMKSYENAVNALENEKNALTLEKEAIEKNYLDETNRLNDTVKKLQVELSELESKYNGVLAELEAMNGSNEALESLKAYYEAEIFRLTDERNTYLEEALAYEKAYKDKESELNDAIAQHESEIASMHASHLAEIGYINDQHAQQISSLNAQHNEQIEKLNSEKAALKDEINRHLQSIAALEAQLKSLTDSQTYFIIFDYGTFGPSMQYTTAKTGDVINAAPYAPAVEGYAITGWLLDGVTPITLPYTVTRNAVLVAVYERDSYPISFDLNGGTMSYYPKEYSTSAGSMLPSPERSGYVFSGWYESYDFGGNPIYAIPAGEKGEKYLYARWTPEYDNVTYTLRSGAAYTSSYYEVTGYTGGSSTAAIADEIDGIPVTTVRLGAFSGSDVSEIIIGNNVSNIYLTQSLNCSMLISFTVSSDNTRFFAYNGVLYERTDNGGNKLVAYPTCRGESPPSIPSFTTEIGERAFSGANISFVNVPESVKSIGMSAFENCQSLYTVTLAEGLEYINMWAFSQCSLLYQVVLPKSVKGIDDYAFDSCRADITFFYGGNESDWPTVSLGTRTGISASNLYYYSETKPAGTGYYWHYLNGGIRIWENIDYGNGLAYDYGSADGTCIIIGIGNYADKDVVIPNYINGLLVVGVADRAFAGNTDITSVTMQGSVERIGEEAFYGCTSLQYVELAGSVYYIGAKAFADSNIKSIILPAVLMHIGTNAFDNCYNLSAVYYSSSKSNWESCGFKIESTSPIAYVLYYYAESTPNEVGWYWNRIAGEINTFYVPNPI